MLKAALTAVLAALLLASPAVAQDEPEIIKGWAQIIGGDRLRLGDRRVRFYGVDAPERGEPGFEAATAEMKKQAEGDFVFCEIVERDRDGWGIAICKGLLAGEEYGLVDLPLGLGLVKVYREYEHLRPDVIRLYGFLEMAAKSSCRGLWANEAECR